MESSLLRLDPSSGRYDLHELVRQFALSKLAERGLEEQVRERHLGYFLNLAVQVQEAHDATKNSMVYETIEREIDNLRAAMTWIIESQQSDAALRMLVGLGMFWWWCGYWREGRDWSRRLLACAGDAPTDRILGQALLKASWIEGPFDHEEGHRKGAQAFEIFSELGNRAGMADALYNMAWHDHFVGNNEVRERGLAIFEESLRIFRELENRARIADTLFRIGTTLMILGRLTEARRALEESLTIAQKQALDFDNANALLQLAEVDYLEDDSNSAYPMTVKAVGLFRKLGNKVKIAWSLILQGEIEIEQGDYPAARSSLAESLQFYSAAGCAGDVGQILCILGQVALREGRLKEALLNYQGGLCQVGEDFQNVVYLVSMIEVFLGLEEIERAAKLLGCCEQHRHLFELARTPIYQREFERIQEATKAQMSEAAFAAAWAEGQAMSLEQAVAEVMEYRAGDLSLINGFVV